jgi:hypothetical protein
MEGATIVMQDPYNLSTKFREYKDYELVSLPVGQSALTYLMCGGRTGQGSVVLQGLRSR